MGIRLPVPCQKILMIQRSAEKRTGSFNLHVVEAQRGIWIVLKLLKFPHRLIGLKIKRASGDALGARLMRALKKKTENRVEFFGIGGDTMEKEGMKSLFDISELAIMGLCEVIPSIPRVLKRIRQTVDDIMRVRPDVVISIDSWSFSSRVQKKLRALKTGIPQIHYVAPQVWAWKKKRARTMHKYVDRLLTYLRRRELGFYRLRD